jgi:DUF971 family protein
MHPTELNLNRDRTQLAVTWDNGSSEVFPAAVLRHYARDAASVRRTVDGLTRPATSGITIIAVEPVGNYAVRLVFSDGHDRGIFPWSYLAEIAGEQQRLPQIAET